MQFFPSFFPPNSNGSVSKLFLTLFRSRSPRTEGQLNTLFDFCWFWIKFSPLCSKLCHGFEWERRAGVLNLSWQAHSHCVFCEYLKGSFNFHLNKQVGQEEDKMESGKDCIPGFCKRFRKGVVCNFQCIRFARMGFIWIRRNDVHFSKLRLPLKSHHVNTVLLLFDS